MKPRVLMSGARTAYIGQGLDLAPHKNAVATVVVALEQPMVLKLLADDAQASVSRRVAVIPPQTQHHLKAQGAMVFLYLDAYSDDYAAIKKTGMGAVDQLDRLYQAIKAVPASNPAEAIAALCHAIGLPQRPRQSDRLVKTVRAIDHRPQDFESVALAAQHAGLSPSRFQSCFRTEVGLPFRRYRLWRRMAKVTQALAAGSTLTQAALEAGFSSSAHLSTAFKAMFGIRPMDLMALGAQFELAEDAPAEAEMV